MQDWHRSWEPLRILVEAERGRQRRQRDAAGGEGRGKRMGVDSLDDGPAAEDHRARRPAQQPVAIDEYEIGSGAETLGHGRFGNSERNQIHQRRRAHRVDDRHSPREAQGDELFQGNGGGPADGREIVRCDQGQRGRSFADGGGVVVQSCLVRCSHLAAESPRSGRRSPRGGSRPFRPPGLLRRSPRVRPRQRPARHYRARRMVDDHCRLSPLRRGASVRPRPDDRSDGHPRRQHR